MKALVYRFKLSDREFAGAWLREHYRRPGLRVVRILAGPGLAALGASMYLRSGERFTTIMGLVTLAFGVWLVLKPFVTAWALTARRRRTNRADVELEVRLDKKGLRVGDGVKTTELPWDKLAAAGATHRYVWIELKTGTRATIPLRAVPDRDALQELLSSHLAWKG